MLFESLVAWGQGSGKQLKWADEEFKRYLTQVAEIAEYCRIKATSEPNELNNPVELACMQDIELGDDYSVPPNGGIVMHFYMSENPYALHTPLGKFPISQYSDKKSIDEFSRFDPTKIKEMFMDSKGNMVGPYYSLRKDLHGKELPSIFWSQMKAYVFTKAHRDKLREMWPRIAPDYAEVQATVRDVLKQEECVNT